MILFLFILIFSRYLIKFLGKVSKNSEVNKMNASNIAIVIAPNIIWSAEDQGWVCYLFTKCRNINSCSVGIYRTCGAHIKRSVNNDLSWGEAATLLWGDSVPAG